MKRGRRRDKIPPREIREAFELYLDGTTQKEIAKRLKMSEMTVSRWAKRYNWKEKREKYMKDWTEAIAKDKIKDRNKKSWDSMLYS